MHWLLFVFSIITLTIVYYLGYFVLAITLRTNNRHYFLGFGNSLFEFKIKDVVFTVGLFIPVFGLARFRKIEDHTRKRSDYPWQFFNRGLLVRFLSTFGGVLSLFITALLIMIGVKLFTSDRYISRDEINKYGIYPSALAEEYGFQKGDKVLAVNGRDFKTYNELLDPDVYAEAGNTFKVARNGNELIIRVPEGNHDIALGRPFLELMIPVEIDSIMPGSLAEEIQLQKRDRIMRVDDVKVDRISDMQEAFSNDSDGTVSLQIQRVIKTDTVIFDREAKLGADRKLGIFTWMPIDYTIKSNSASEAIQKGVKATFQLLTIQFSSWFRVMNPGSVKAKSGGPIGVATVFGDQVNWELFWYLTASYTIFFVAWNFVPFPRSAFLEVIPLAYEGVTKKKFPYSVFRRIRSISWFIFWGLILFTFIMDISKLF